MTDPAAVVVALTIADVLPEGVDPETFIPDVEVGQLEPNAYCRAHTKQGENVYCHMGAGHGTTHPTQGRCKYHGGLTHGDGRLRTGKYSLASGIKHPRIIELYEKFKDDPDPTGLFDELALLRAIAMDFIERYEQSTAALLAWHADQKILTEPLRADLVRGFEQAFDIWESGKKSDDGWTPEIEREAERARKLLHVLRHGPDVPRPRRVLDISDVTAIIEAIGRMAERIEKLRTGNAISEVELNRIINMMARVVDIAIPNGFINDGIAAEERMHTGEKFKETIRAGWIDIVTR